MNERIAKALAEDVKRKGTSGGMMEFHDDDAVYTVSVTVRKEAYKTFRESRGGFLSMSGGAPGSPCGCCSGTGRA